MYRYVKNHVHKNETTTMNIDYCVWCFILEKQATNVDYLLQYLIFQSDKNLLQIPRILERYSQYLENITVSKMDDWACISGLKK